jgi:hypothetical protein
MIFASSPNFPDETLITLANELLNTGICVARAFCVYKSFMENEPFFTQAQRLSSKP